MSRRGYVCGLVHPDMHAHPDAPPIVCTMPDGHRGQTHRYGNGYLSRWWVAIPLRKPRKKRPRGHRRAR